jgi:hypothetical protein
MPCIDGAPGHVGGQAEPIPSKESRNLPHNGKTRHLLCPGKSQPNTPALQQARENRDKGNGKAICFTGITAAVASTRKATVSTVAGLAKRRIPAAHSDFSPVKDAAP